MLLYPPVESSKGYLLTLFQAGTMEFPEGIAFDEPWAPSDYLRFCVNEISALVHGKRDRACLPISVTDEGDVLQSFWGLERYSPNEIAIAENIRFLDEHFVNVQHLSENWWKDVYVCKMEDRDWNPWAKVDVDEVLRWLSHVAGYTEQFRVCDETIRSDATNCEQTFVLTPPFRVGDRGQYFFSTSPEVLLERETCSLEHLTALDYFRHWWMNLYALIDTTDTMAILVLDVDKSGSPVKWSIVRTDEKARVHFSHPIANRIDGCFNRRTGDFDIPESVVDECAEHMCDIQAAFTSDAVFKWVYSGKTLLNLADLIDKDDDVEKLR